MKKYCLVIFFILPNIIFATVQTSYCGIIMANTFYDMQQEYGADIFSHKPVTQATLVLGHKFTQIICFEFNYSSSINKMNYIYVSPVTAQFSVPNFTSIVSSVYSTKRTFNAYSVLYSPNIKLSNNLFITPMLGIAYFDITADLFLQDFDNASATIQEQLDYNTHFTTSKLVPQMGLRFAYNITSRFGILFNYLYSLTGNTSMRATRNINPQLELVAKLKNWSSIGVGLYCNILY